MNPAFFSLSVYLSVAATTLFASRPVKWPSPSRKRGWKRPLLRGPSHEKKRPYIYRNWLQLSWASYILWRWTYSFVSHFGLYFPKLEGTNYALPMGVVKKERLSQLYGIDPFHTGLFLKALVASVMTLAQLFLIDPFISFYLNWKRTQSSTKKTHMTFMQSW